MDLVLWIEGPAELQRKITLPRGSFGSPWVRHTHTRVLAVTVARGAAPVRPLTTPPTPPTPEPLQPRQDCPGGSG